MKNVVLVIVLAACAAVGGFAVGRMGVGGASKPAAEEREEPSVEVRRKGSKEDSAELSKARKRIAELERMLAGEREKAKCLESASRREEDAVADAINAKTAQGGSCEGTTVSVGTNADIVAELKRQLPEEAFVAATNALSGLRAKLAERAKGRMEYLASVDVSQMGKADRENHAKFLKLLKRREATMAKMKGGIPDAKTLEEMVTLDMEMRPVAKAERSALVREIARELGYAGEDADVLHDTLEAVFDCTSSSGLGGIMEAADGQPEISIQTQVIGL